MHSMVVSLISAAKAELGGKVKGNKNQLSLMER